jgi:hypothetical protein
MMSLFVFTNNIALFGLFLNRFLKNHTQNDIPIAKMIDPIQSLRVYIVFSPSLQTPPVRNGILVFTS